MKVQVLNVRLLKNTPMGQTRLAVAEMERNIIIERTQEGKTIAKQLEGRPKKFTKAQLDHAMKLKKTQLFRQVAKMIQSV